MWYLSILAFAIAAIGAWFFFKKASPNGSLDVNKDNKLDVNDIKFTADINKDGKVDVADAKAAIVEVAVEMKNALVEAPKVEVAEIEAPKPAEKAKKTQAKKAAAPKKLSLIHI